MNAATSSGLGATVVFHFDGSASELNGGSRDLSLWSSTDAGNTWTAAGGAVDSVHGTVTQTGITHLSRWSASAFPMVSTNSKLSDIVAGSLTIPSSISSYTTTQAGELPAFSFIVRDGGGSPDSDSVPTILNSVTIEQGAANTATNWTQYIQGADLYSGATHLGSATVAANTLTFTGSPVVSVPDDNNTELTLKVYLKTSLPAGADNKVLEFKVNQNSDVVASGLGSVFALGGSDVAGTPGTSVAVVAGKLQFGNISGGTLTGHTFTASVAGVDTNGNIDADFVDAVNVAIDSGSGILSGTNPKSAVGGTASFTDLSIAGYGYFKLIATSGILGSGISNSFVITAPATFRVANTGIPQMNWDSTGTWIVDAGFSLTGIPDRRLDSVILDNKYHPGSYTINAGIHKQDTCGFLGMGYVGNPNTIKLSLPAWGDSIRYKLVVGDSLPANYDMVMWQGGYFDMQSRWAGSYPWDMAGYHSPDSIYMHKGSYMYWASAGYQTMFYNFNTAIDTDYGTVELDVPPNFTDFNWGGHYTFGNLTLSNTHGAHTYYPYGTGTGVIKGNLTINPGVVDSLDLGAGSFIWIGGNIINNGNTAITNSMVVMAQTYAVTTPQTITGNSIRLKGGMAIANPSGVTASADLHVEGGTVQTTGAIMNGVVSLGIPANGVLNMGTSTMYLDPAGSMNEGAGVNPVHGKISATRTLTTSDEPFGNIGFEVLSASVAPGLTSVVRQSGTSLTGNGHTSLKRYYDVTPTVNAGLNAAVKVSYSPQDTIGTNITESGVNPYSPILQKSSDGGTTWTAQTIPSAQPSTR